MKIIERVEKLENDVTKIMSNLKMIKNANITCDKCGYEWYTKTKLSTVSCPNCGTKNKVNENAKR